MRPCLEIELDEAATPTTCLPPLQSVHLAERAQGSPVIKAEMETTLTFDSEERLVRIFSARPGDQGKVRRAGIEPVRGSLKTGFFYELPLSRLSWRIKKAGIQKTRVLPSDHPFLRGQISKLRLSHDRA